ncbi:hypothetical protein CHS0354_024178 [Potamilus streckersoni]|uniref:Succinate--CoA ligase [ADP/GDP-forming] subunit alpha, mitochondrial n=1 Tax=Potamilus streckersoni TaxID=2493646 RepID=A0AAE0RZS9_9BIVA|nr:hypothetical protein CHS0354_024178 [Potamilus streckersoni]
MSVLVGKETKLVVQGITGSEGTFHTSQMIEYGTNVVAGVTPGKGGSTYKGNEQYPFLNEVPIFNSVQDAVNKTKANTSAIFVPAAFAADAIMEAADAKIKVVICITEGIPVSDMIKAHDYIKSKKGVTLIGPNCPGVITPGKAKVGIMPGFIHKPGQIGVISRSGTLTYEAVHQLTKLGLGQSTCIGIGGDPVIGMRFIDAVKLFAQDKETKGLVMIGEIGGTAEEEAAQYIKRYFKKPVVGFIAGASAPEGRRMGHAGAIISGGKGTAKEKFASLRAAGIHVVENPALIGKTMLQALEKKLTINFGPKLNIITGETGAGKSILLGALNIVLGERANTDLIRAGSDKAIVEATLNITNNFRLIKIIEEQNLSSNSQDNLILLRRELSTKSSSRCFINDSLVPLHLLREISDLAIDLHGQHEHQSLLHIETHLSILDNYGNLESLRETFHNEYQQILQVKKRLVDVQKNGSKHKATK